ncbi:PREDICTED: DNA mismatch repair protein MSH6-like isoform X1 [Lupinus angustifolius]|uniref:DNA mismatch repair protein MSH6-like isoform X1 n=1 Tax=Lupinus angustifolius TaxID=3871 RepID=UPI00092F1AD0|nr:PREDICTED: DNA mismatch repair protein MSH6-like isoform X1 [Lupinus angustifolius]
MGRSGCNGSGGSPLINPQHQITSSSSSSAFHTKPCKKSYNNNKRKTSDKELEPPSKKSTNNDVDNEKNGPSKLSILLHNVETSDDDAAAATSQRFAVRQAHKFRFLTQDCKDAEGNLPHDENYDSRTLYLPLHFLKSLSGGQKQWWEFKSKHMDKVVFFKVGKFYELFEMDAHVGVKELDLQYMKGEQPHCGFPEKNFLMNVEKLARKGYRVLVVEQTETPEQMELRRKVKGSKDKVVRREICAVVTKGTLTDGELLSANPEAPFLMALTECHKDHPNANSKRIYGICLVDVTTSRVILGQFKDDLECSALSCILSEIRPVEIIKPAKLLSAETERVLLKHTRNPLVNELVPIVEFWDADITVDQLKKFYRHTNDVRTEEDSLDCLPDVLQALVEAGDESRSALSALGGALYYLKQAFLDETLLRFAQFELLPSSGFCGLDPKPSYMILDAAALDNLEVFENNQDGGSSGTLYGQLNQCVTASGKRLLKTWLARPLCHVRSIKKRQHAVAGLKGVNLPYALEFQKALSKLPDMERLLARIFSASEASGRNANRVILYEDAAKKQLQEFTSALCGCEMMVHACSSLGMILNHVKSSQLRHLLTAGEGLPDVRMDLNHFKEAFDWVEANNSGRIIPHEGVDLVYDSVCEAVKEIQSSLFKHLKEQKKLLGDTSITYVTVGKEAYLLEVPENSCGNIPRDYDLRSSRKGFFRYWTPDIKKFLRELSQAEAEKECLLKSTLQRLMRRFCEHHTKWRQLVSVTAELDVLISLAIAGDCYEGPTCRPRFLGTLSSKDAPYVYAKSLGHPVLRSDSLGKGSFVPNDITLGGQDHASFILLTGPNMGGKSTLLRQVCLAVILAQVGADVPAESMKLSPVDRIFVQMGAKDNIMAGQSTFLTELLETATMLSSATHNSLVALDELGRGTSTSDGQAIAEAVLEYLVRKVQCLGLFSTHYHRLAIVYHQDPKVSLCHMACQVGDRNAGVDVVTFLYRLTPGACPKSYGINVARLAGLPISVLKKAAAKSREFEAMYGKCRMVSSEANSSEQNLFDEMTAIVRQLSDVVKDLNCPDTIFCSTLIELQGKAREFLQRL